MTAHCAPPIDQFTSYCDSKPIHVPPMSESGNYASRTYIERFEAKFIPEPNSGCWIWTANLNHAGYGRIVVGKIWVLAHRFSYQTYKGHLIPGLVLDHLCRMRCCVNPDHLEQVTLTVNIQRGGPSLNTACPSGHPWTEENTWINPKKNSRCCRQCNRDNAKRYYHSRKASS